MVYDVERHSDRCVCGCSALATCHDYNSVNCGYCESCAKKRTDFVTDITGVISVGEENCFEYAILATIENIRQNIFKEQEINDYLYIKEYDYDDKDIGI